MTEEYKVEARIFTINDSQDLRSKVDSVMAFYVGDGSGAITRVKLNETKTNSAGKEDYTGIAIIDAKLEGSEQVRRVWLSLGCVGDRPGKKSTVKLLPVFTQVTLSQKVGQVYQKLSSKGRPFINCSHVAPALQLYLN